MLEIYNFHKKRLNFRIIVSILILTLLLISPVAALSGNIDFFHSPVIKSFSKQIDITYILEGFGVAILIGLTYSLITRGAIRKAVLDQEVDQEKIETKRIRLFTIIPVLFISLAELLIFSGKIEAAIWVHIWILIALSLSNVFIKDLKIHKIHMALMLLPVLRLINISMPVFFETSMYIFIFTYGSLAIPVTFIVMNQRESFEEIGITTKNFLPYMIISIPLGFLLGLGEYMIIRPGYLIPDLTFGNMLQLTIIMVFFVGLVEELIFRTILQTRLEQELSVQEALIITSLLFGLMHSGYGTLNELLYTGVVGFVMGFAFYKTRSLPFIAVLHGFVNIFLYGVFSHNLIDWAWL